MRISDWSSDVCSSDLGVGRLVHAQGVVEHVAKIQPGFIADQVRVQAHQLRQDVLQGRYRQPHLGQFALELIQAFDGFAAIGFGKDIRFQRAQFVLKLACQRLQVVDDEVERSEEHTSELQSLMRISYAVFCLKKKKQHQ